MLDDNDVDDMATASLFSNGWVSIIFAVIMIVTMFAVCNNKKECAQQRCADGTAAVLMDHACRCVSAPVAPAP